METVAQVWAGFAAAVVPPDAPAEQHREMRRAFYAGAWAMLQKVVEASGTLDETDAEAYLSALEAEMIRFHQDVAEGRA